jgi:hypothetical protein
MAAGAGFAVARAGGRRVCADAATAAMQIRTNTAELAELAE